MSDALLLARIQFGFTAAFHIVLPAFTIGLASYLAVLEALWLCTGKSVYIETFRFWLRIFAISFALGVVSGLTMSYQFGTNWSVFSDRVGPVVGPLMAYEVLSAFFLEAGFLGVMLFGIDRVGKWPHFGATLAVAFGTAISAFWILSVNSWMQTPQGYVLGPNGQYVPSDWIAVIFNPSFPYRLIHMLFAAYLTTALAVGAVGAWHLRHDKGQSHARLMFSMAMWMLTVVAPLQLGAGDMHGLNTLRHQPVKVLAMEGHFEPSPDGASLILFGLPDTEQRKVLGEVAVPKLGSLILLHDPDAPLKGLNDFPERDWPPVAIVFWSFRIMVGLGVAMIALGFFSLYARVRGRLYAWRSLHRVAVLMGPAGFAAVIAGWITTEVGRQPWVVYGLLRTSEAVSPVSASAVGASLLAYVLVYFAVFGAGFVYMWRLARKRPDQHGQDAEAAPIRTAGITPAPAVAKAR